MRKNEDVEDTLKEWFLKVREKDARVSGQLLRQKAENLAKKKMIKHDFQASKGRASDLSSFADWLTKWGRQLKWNILLLVDNCAAHATDLNLKNINIVFLPANTTSLIQPCDQGIIPTLKSRYRTEMRRNIINVMGTGLEGTGTLRASGIAKKISLLEELHFVKKAWDEVSDVTIRKPWRLHQDETRG
ncbi:hypothetical protein AVEN_171355-1 [Araneus ventricosus]|uniref:HTH CENPB-type domain-containing protein n=1 Tax=Araneus ventricosus TaxID=182803 RepID=A0A4Y2KD17_ARAVE|nr:hypothetical protein AVEN_171355-1 [Araneus ventricosus]